MELNQIEAFVTIVDTRTFSQAALQLYISQPAISRRISLLEKELGSPLFERLPGSVELTEAGVRFLPFARQALAAVQDGLAAVQSFGRTVQGTIKLALVGTLASTNLTEKLQTFKEKYPQVRLLLQTARSNEVSVMVQNGDVHLGLRYFSGAEAHIEAQVIDEEQLVVACPMGFSHEEDHQMLIAALSNTAWISFPLDKRSSGEPFAQVIQRLLISANLDNVEVIYIDSLTAQKRLIEAGFGVGLLPLSSIQEELRLGSIETLDLPELQATVPIMMLHRKNGYLPPGAEALLNELTSIN